MVNFIKMAVSNITGNSPINRNVLTIISLNLKKNFDNFLGYMLRCALQIIAGKNIVKPGIVNASARTVEMRPS